MSLALQVHRLFPYGVLLYTHLGHGIGVLVNLDGNKVKSDKNDDDKQERGPSEPPPTIDSLLDGEVVNHFGSDKRKRSLPCLPRRMYQKAKNMVEGIVGQVDEELGRHPRSWESNNLVVSTGTLRGVYPVRFDHF